jgi:hypothetical protein
MGLDTPPQRALGGDLDRIRVDLEVGEPKLFEMCGPGVLIAELPVGMIGQARDHMGCQVALAHIGECLGIDHVVAVTGSQKVQEVCTVLGVCCAKPGEMRVADLGAEAVLCLVTSPGVIHGDPRGA